MEAEQPMEMTFGESWDRDQQAAKYYALQYKFKPQSASRQGRGAIQIDQASVRCLP